MKFIAPMLLGIIMGCIIIFLEPVNKDNHTHRKHRCWK